MALRSAASSDTHSRRSSNVPRVIRDISIRSSSSRTT